MTRRLKVILVALMVGIVAVAAACASTTTHKKAGAAAHASTAPNCSTLSSFSDSFETVYASSNGGMNPSVCTTTRRVPNDQLHGTTWQNKVPSCIKDVVAPTPGDGPHAIEVNAVAGAGVNGSHPSCTWAQRWRYEQQNTDYYYGFMWYFAHGWVAPSGLQYELNFQPNICGAPIGIRMFGHAVKLQMRTGKNTCLLTGTGHHAGSVQYSNGGGSSATSSGNLGGLAHWSIIPQGHLQTGKWYEVILHIHWATDSTGQVQSWYRLKGQARWNQTINQSGMPTLEWGCKPNHATQTCTNITPSNQNGWVTVDHFGFYRYCNRDPCPADRYYVDNWQQQSSFAAVAATMP
jgi:hypothetical protein